ncbi:MAG: ribonuclease H family protein [Erysipelotrichaceae bacterium]|nr:ribonuclease H family protein [Erysipelotrichaceae bacterium]
MAKYYAVKKGRQIGIFSSWEECEKQIKGYSGASYKSFSSLNQAKDFLDDEKIVSVSGLIAYVDGSYNNKTKEYGYGCVLLKNQQVLESFYGKGNHPNYVSMRNVAGEIAGAQVAVNYALDNHYTHIWIYYDYEGIEKWANGNWKANKVGTKAYQQFIKDSRSVIDIDFVKVLAHSGDQYNDEADKLAKKAVGL